MTRVLSGVALSAGALAAILLLPTIGLRILACAVAGLAAVEFLRIVGGHEGYVVGVVIVTWLVSRGAPGELIVLPVVIFVLSGLMALLPQTSARQAILGGFAILYLSVPLGMLAALHADRGWRVTVLLIATVVVSDSLQFYAGRLFGRHPLAPAISPKKTIEGAIGGLIGGAVFMTLAGPLAIAGLPPMLLAGLGVVMVLLGIAGDLFESKLKREASVKDSSSLIPGHGGVLDRIDALLFVTPVFALFLGSWR